MRSVNLIFTSVSIACMAGVYTSRRIVGKWRRHTVIGKNTRRLPVDVNGINSPTSIASLGEAAELLRTGCTVAFPTETVYGLGANALDPAAVQKIFEAKQRPSWDPLIVHVVNEEQLATAAVDIPHRARLLMEAFWPGPLTLLLPKSRNIPEI
ncbi:MAG: L-threonylcarbamoyladenylate synthase, partial [Acidobacteriaceae bacterium]